MILPFLWTKCFPLPLLCLEPLEYHIHLQLERLTPLDLFGQLLSRLLQLSLQTRDLLVALRCLVVHSRDRGDRRESGPCGLRSDHRVVGLLYALRSYCQ